MKSVVARLAARFGFARFRRDEKGATAVEFALVGLPFIALIFGILETALIFFAGQTLETAVANSARLIRTGQAQQLGYTESQFQDSICQQIVAVFNCASNLKLDVRTYQTFDTIDISKPVDANGNLKNDFIYVAGHGGDIVVVRAFYEWPTWSRLLGLNLSNMTDGTHLLAATAAFRNEPFPW